MWLLKALRILLTAGRPAAPADIWIRHLIAPGETKKNRTPNHPKVWQNAFRVVDHRHWSAEASGRMGSRANSIKTFAEDEAKRIEMSNPGKGFKYRGFFYQRCDILRSLKAATFDVILTPSRDDIAHGDLVILGEIPRVDGQISRRVWDELRDSIKFVQADDAAHDIAESSALLRR